MERASTLGELLATIAGSALRAELDAIREAFSDSPDPVYLVGGVVRDLLLGRVTRDIDLCIEGELDPALDRLVSCVGGEPRRHPEFLTAGLVSNAGFTVDLARTRREEYAEPAALPRVEPGSLSDDLRRRDFTVNALAVALRTDSERLIDPFGGGRDLETRRLRVLHDGSFSDDPTRLLRGIRLAAELDFGWESGTYRQAAAEPARRALCRLGGFRLWRELRYCFSTGGRAARTVAALAELGLLSAIHPSLKATTAVGRELEAIDQRGETPSALEILAVWCRGLGDRELRKLADRLELTRAERARLGVGSSRRGRPLA